MKDTGVFLLLLGFGLRIFLLFSIFYFLFFFGYEQVDLCNLQI